MRTETPLLVALVLTLAAETVSGQPATLERVAVLELDLMTSRLKMEDAQYLTDAVRGAATDTLDPKRFWVMTRENMDLIVPPEERQCMNNLCYAAIGKRLQAQYVVGGSLRDVSGLIGITLEVYDKNGGLLGSVQGEAKDLREALALVRRLAPQLIGRIAPGSRPGPAEVGVAVPGSVERVGEIKPEVGYLRVEGSPKGARVDISGPREFGDRGKVATALPYGPEQVPAGRYRVEVSASGYDTESREVFVPADKTVAVDVALVASEGVLEVTGKPEGARVDLSCAKGFSRTFGLPGTLSVPRGECTVKVTRTGYEPFEKTVSVEGGKTARVEVTLAEERATSSPRAVAITGPRFVDNGDGTVTDRKYRLVWSKKSFGRMSWEDAVAYCRKNRGGLPGSGWHLPTIDELRTLIVGCPATEPGGRCPAREGCRSREDCWGGDWKANCAPCEVRGGPGPRGCYSDQAFDDPCDWFWSSTSVPWSSSSAFDVNFNDGHVSSFDVGYGNGVRCVRAGQE